MTPPDEAARRRERERRTARDLQRLLQNLEPLPEATVRPALVVMVGLPGTGKSYFSRKLKTRIPAVVVESDRVRQVLFPEPRYSSIEHYIVFQRCHALVEELLSRSVTVIFDATNLIERHREYLYQIGQRHDARLLMVHVQAAPDIVRQRLEARLLEPGSASEAGWEVYEKMLPTMERIRRAHYVVDTTRDIRPAIEKVVRDVRQA